MGKSSLIPKFEVNRTNIKVVMISVAPSVSSVHLEFDGRLSSTVVRTDETTKSDYEDHDVGPLTLYYYEQQIK